MNHVVRKGFRVCGVWKVFHVGRIFLLSKGIHPTDVSQHVSHTCECWGCFEHTLWEYSFANTKIRKCHFKGKDNCKCGLSPKCVFPPPRYPLWTSQPCVVTPAKKNGMKHDISDVMGALNTCSSTIFSSLLANLNQSTKPVIVLHSGFQFLIMSVTSTVVKMCGRSKESHYDCIVSDL